MKIIFIKAKKCKRSKRNKKPAEIYQRKPKKTIVQLFQNYDGDYKPTDDVPDYGNWLVKNFGK